MHTLFDRLGGAPAIEATVDAFYGRVLADPLLSPMFAQVPMDRMRPTSGASSDSPSAAPPNTPGVASRVPTPDWSPNTVWIIATSMPY